MRPRLSAQQGKPPAGRAKRKPRRYAKRGALVPAGEGEGGARPPQQPAGREVLCQDAVAWLEQLAPAGLPPGSCVVTGVPDIHEVDPEHRMGARGWQDWFVKVVLLILSRLPEGGAAILMQTDVKVPRDDAERATDRAAGSYWQWVDKAHLVLAAAEQVPDVRLLWHKVILSEAKSTEATGRSSMVAGFSHLLCIAKGGEPEPLSLAPFPDVMRKGLATWVSGSGARVVEHVCTYVRERGHTLVVDPFCGEGSVLAVANTMGLAALGVEQCSKRAKVARKLDGERFLAADRLEQAGTEPALD